jgi:hypothetical protein
MLYCYKPLDIFWTDNETLDFKAFWNPSEHEWRIPAYDGISVSESNVVALAGDIQTAMGNSKLTYEKGTTVRGRKNPKVEH